MTLIKCSVNFRALNFQYLNPNSGTSLTPKKLYIFHLPLIFHLSQKLRRRFTIFRVHLHRCRCQKFNFGQGRFRIVNIVFLDRMRLPLFSLSNRQTSCIALLDRNDQVTPTFRILRTVVSSTWLSFVQF